MIGLNENRVILNLRYAVAYSGGLSLKVSHVPTKLFSYSQSSAEQQEKVRKKPQNQLMGWVKDEEVTHKFLSWANHT